MSSTLARRASNILLLRKNAPLRTIPNQSLEPAEFPRLVVLSTPLRGMELVLRPYCRGWRRWVLGSGKGVDFRITDSTLHDTHLIIERQGEDWLVSCPPDCWGFFVNDEPLETAVVEHGDRLRVGRHELVFVGGELGVTEQDEKAVQPRWWRRLYRVS